MNIKTEIKDLEALKSACLRLGLRTSGDVVFSDLKFQLFNSEETGTAVYLPGWKYPVVIREDGALAMDNYGGRWGDIAELNKLTAYYGLEKAKLEAWKQGYSVTEGYDTETDELTLTVNVEEY
jgi:hypothetical protein